VVKTVPHHPAEKGHAHRRKKSTFCAFADAPCGPAGRPKTAWDGKPEFLTPKWSQPFVNKQVTNNHRFQNLLPASHFVPFNPVLSRGKGELPLFLGLMPSFKFPSSAGKLGNYVTTEIRARRPLHLNAFAHLPIPENARVGREAGE
jgi:hypothetical protein